jgi:hypothetical protein
MAARSCKDISQSPMDHDCSLSNCVKCTGSGVNGRFPIRTHRRTDQFKKDETLRRRIVESLRPALRAFRADCQCVQSPVAVEKGTKAVISPNFAVHGERTFNLQTNFILEIPRKSFSTATPDSAN